jgi:hypothetical protein
MQLEKVYEPGLFDPRWARWWVESAIYHPKWKPGRPVFSLVIQPPTVTGVLHVLGDVTLWPEFLDLPAALKSYLNQATGRIGQEVFGEAAERVGRR